MLKYTGWQWQTQPVSLKHQFHEAATLSRTEDFCQCILLSQKSKPINPKSSTGRFWHRYYIGSMAQREHLYQTPLCAANWGWNSMQRATFLTGSESWPFTFVPFSVKVKSPKKFVFAVFFKGLIKITNVVLLVNTLRSFLLLLLH